MSLYNAKAWQVSLYNAPQIGFASSLFFLLAHFNLTAHPARLSPNKSVFLLSQHLLKSVQLIGGGRQATPYQTAVWIAPASSPFGPESSAF